MDKLEELHSVEDELIGGTLEEDVKHFEARLIARALEQENAASPARRENLDSTHQGLSKILDGRQSKSLARSSTTKKSSP